ncbi:MAG TPA: hemerythrin domain-containing protein [Syntrophales bacterium]|nr:hemerythrin domain-containing protein [Syntrophales bacterium]HOU78130.1 hemerythrin domain-containing protein [Syntrophales bacterium]HPC32131.1 hemerythrin domain-containing protein [Syntrophales bacterium]HQG33702.1 hemerythrin domain-containing protein [Syntrophales bacterium]HQI36248.1 hemerythrin domain-containing protein [Syntrophales bacterium]
MKPIGPLMWEHRLIEKMLEVVTREASRMEAAGEANPAFIDTAVDFIRTYADRTHHGKEEDILFRELKKKKLTPEHARIMDELIQEHVYSRRTVGKLVAAKERYVDGDRGAVGEIVALLKELASFYPRHIAKEDKPFFHECQRYFTDAELDEMLGEFREFDRKMIHEKYERLLESFTGEKAFKAGRAL